MDTKDLLKELTDKLERLQEYEAVGTGKRRGSKGKRGPMSAATKAKLAAAQKKRWAKVRAEKAKG